MSPAEGPVPFVPSASEYILDNFEPNDRIAILVLNRDFGETIQRITSAQKAASPEFQAWLRYKNANGSDIYVGMNPLKKDASTRTKEEIESIRHVYLDLDHGGPEALESIENSGLVPKPNYVLNSSPEKYQVVWKVEGMNLEEAKVSCTLWRMSLVAIPPPPTRLASCGSRDSPTKSTRQTSICSFAENPRTPTTSAISNYTSTPRTPYATTMTAAPNASRRHAPT